MVNNIYSELMPKPNFNHNFRFGFVRLKNITTIKHSKNGTVYDDGRRRDGRTEDGR